MTKKIRPPWTPEQVAALNAFQTGPFHPFTCPNVHDDQIRVLRATPTGWMCRGCDYRQLWAHAFMAEETGLRRRGGAR